MASTWQVYEDAARRVLSDLREALSLAKVEGKQTLLGASGAAWEVDAKAWKEGSDWFVIIEVRRQTTSGVKQEAVAAVAHRLQDVGAEGGIIVSPLPLQKGAELVACHAEIVHVTLSPESTTERYLAEFMGSCFLGASVNESANARASSSAALGWAPKSDA
jgi:hypothetical protein